MKKWPSIVSIVLFLAIGAYAVDVIVYNANLDKKSEIANVKQEIKPDPPTRSELLRLVNQERAKHGVAPLKEDAQLDSTAQWKADDMNTRHYFGHYDPETGKRNGLDKMMDNVGSRCTFISENILENDADNTSKGSVATWISSKPHHLAMIDKQYVYTGFGISGTYVVEHFCNPV